MKRPATLHRRAFKPLQSGDGRKTSCQRGYGYAWQQFRLSYLARHPICVQCDAEGVVEPATVVDHITPHKGDKVKFWDEENMQALCKRHHDIKTAKEDGGFGR